jgi:molecular chaperone HtpG
MEKRTLDIHSENILPIIKKWLYSDKDIFVRELVSNSCDACQKVKMLQEQGEIPKDDTPFKIQVIPDKEKGTITFKDNGIGMTHEEVVKYIAQIAFSSAEEFLEKYKSESTKDPIIGHFGLGFYSAYMVADRVDINTLSYKQGAKPVLWNCDGSAEYTIGEGTKDSRGTEITLHVTKEDHDYLEESKLREILNQHCAFLPFPVFLNDTHINTHEPLWIKSPSQCEDKDYLEFYRHLYPFQEDPLFWVHLNVDYPFHLQGILYFPKLKRDFDLSKQTVKLYCNRVFVSDSCKDVIPNYLAALQGVIDSPDIPLNVSRSTLQMDKTVRQLGGHISKKVSDSLNTLYRNDKEKFLSSWKDISLFLKVGIMEDEKFYERTKNLLIWKLVGGDWVTVEEYLEKNKDKTKDKVLYIRDEKQLSHFLDIYQDKGIDIIAAKDPVDPYLFQFLEGKISPAKFQRLDGAIDENLIDKEREKTVLDSEGKTEAAHLADFIREKLSDDSITVEAKSLIKDSVPGFVVFDESQRRMRDYFMSMQPDQDFKAFDKRTFVVNTNSPLFQSIMKLEKKNAPLAGDLVKEVYEISLLSQREMDPKGLHDFIDRSNRILEKLAEEATKS